MIRSYLLNDAGVREDLELDRVLEDSLPEGAFAWIDLEDPTPEEVAQVGDLANLHELTRGEILDADGRPRVEDFKEHLVVVFKAMLLGPVEDSIEGTNVNFLLFGNTLITSHWGEVLAIREIRMELSRGPGRFRGEPARLLHTLLDRIVDRYLDVIEDLEDALGEIEPTVLGDLDPDLPEQLFAWRRRIMRLRRRTSPHREVIMHLCVTPHELVPDSLQAYFRDLLEKVLRIEDRLSSYRELIQGAGDLYMAGAAQQTNEVMKTLSIVATVVLPLNILTGLYGTNFEIIPGAKSPQGFWAFVLCLVLLALATTGYFRWRRWI